MTDYETNTEVLNKLIITSGTKLYGGNGIINEHEMQLIMQFIDKHQRECKNHVKPMDRHIIPKAMLLYRTHIGDRSLARPKKR